MPPAATDYDEKYRNNHYFSYREWLYRPFVKALIGNAALPRGARVLDVGCGQGFFSWLFAEFGLKPTGVDVSSEAVRAANKNYGDAGAAFEVGDATTLTHPGEFDCIFVRGLSLYNIEDFTQSQATTTDPLLSYLKPNGTMIFCYHTNLCAKKRSPSWLYHSLSDAKVHFSSYPGARVYFTLRIETLIFGRWAFCAPLTFLAALISRTTGIAGELVAFVPRT